MRFPYSIRASASPCLRTREVRPTTLRQEARQQLLLQCQGCSSLTVARVASSCDAEGTDMEALVLAPWR